MEPHEREIIAANDRRRRLLTRSMYSKKDLLYSIIITFNLYNARDLPDTLQCERLHPLCLFHYSMNVVLFLLLQLIIVNL
jgi:hypothetical protein